MRLNKKSSKSSKHRLLSRASLYLVLDAQVCSYPKLFEVAKQAVFSGVDIIQLRDKTGTAKDILEFSRKVIPLCKGRALYIINDRVDLAVLSGADGVHLGQDDIACTSARKMLGDKIIGVSCQDLRHLKKAQNDGADYAGFGSVFKTKTKPERLPMNLKLLQKVYTSARIPVFAIGGITLDNASVLPGIGVNRVAVTRALCLAHNIKKNTESFRRIFPHV
jgi:thiamine-phosphate pyrophosphorylase